MRVDAMMGEADGEDEKTLMIQSLRAMVDGLKRQVCACVRARVQVPARLARCPPFSVDFWTLVNLLCLLSLCTASAAARCCAVAC